MRIPPNSPAKTSAYAWHKHDDGEDDDNDDEGDEDALSYWIKECFIDSNSSAPFSEII